MFCIYKKSGIKSSKITYNRVFEDKKAELLLLFCIDKNNNCATPNKNIFSFDINDKAL